MTAPTEAHVLAEILLAWGAHPQVRLWRQNSGLLWAPDGKGGMRRVRAAVPGAPDLAGLLSPAGRYLGIECKTIAGRQSPDQQAFAQMLGRFGGLYILARSVADVDSALSAVGVTRG